MKAAKLTIPGHFLDYMDDHTGYREDVDTDADTARLVTAIEDGKHRNRPAQGSYSVTILATRGAVDVLRERADSLMTFPPADGSDEYSDDEFADRVAADELLTRAAALSYDLEWPFEDAKPAAEPAPVVEDPKPVADVTEPATVEGETFEKPPVVTYPTSSNDGALSRWANTMYEAEADVQRKIDARGGKWEFPALFDLEGRLIAAKEVKGKFGWSWMILRPDGGADGWFTESKAKDPAEKRARDERKGYYVGRILLNAHADLRGGGVGTVMPIAVRDDESGFYPFAEIVDNGHPRPVTAPDGPFGRALAVVEAGATLGSLSPRQTAVLIAALAERAGVPVPAWESSAEDESLADEARALLDELPSLLRP